MDKSLRDDPTCLAIRSNYCNVLFNLYRYDEAVTHLKKLVVILEGQVYPTIVELKKTQASQPQSANNNFRQQVHQLVCNYYLLGKVCLNQGNCLHLSGEKVSGKTKQFSPIDFLQRAEKLVIKYCDNDMMLKNIKGSLAKIEGMTTREPSTMQSMKTIDQTGMVSYYSEKNKAKEAERSHSHTASINSRMLKKSQFSQPKIETVKKTPAAKNFRVMSNPKIQTIDQIRNLFSGVVQIKVEPNIRIVTQGQEREGKQPIRVRHNTESKSIVCSHCHHHITLNDSVAPSQHSEARFSINRHPSSAHKRPKIQPRQTSASSSAKASNEPDELSLNSKDKIKVVAKESRKHRRQSQEMKSNASNTLKDKRASLHHKIEAGAFASSDKTKSKLSTGGTEYAVQMPSSWEEAPPKDGLPRIKTNSGNEVPSLSKAENFAGLSNSGYMTSPENRSKYIAQVMSSGDEQQASSTPVFSKKVQESTSGKASQSKFGVEAQKLTTTEAISKTLSQPTITKKEVSPTDNYWQIPGDKEYRVKLHKTIYDET